MEFEHEKERREKEEDAEKVMAAYRITFRSPTARMVLNDLCRYACIFSPTYREGNADRSAHEEGMRRVVLRILRLSGIEEDMRNLIGGREHGSS